MEVKGREVISLPYKYEARNYQQPLWSAMGLIKGVKTEEYKRGILLWHRRSGKDLTMWNIMICKALSRKGMYFYIFPSYTQGKKILWDGMTSGGMKFTDYIPKQLVVRKVNDEMKVELLNGSIIQIIGAENVDTLVGTNPLGVVFSEYSLQDPTAWGFIRPILLVNDGWAYFTFTPRGKNHAYTLWQMAKKDPKWLKYKQTVDDTHVLTKEQLEHEKKEMYELYGDNSLFNQEYYCSFETSLQGSVYGKQFDDLDKEGRITKCPYEPKLPVYTAWDIGVHDYTAIWFAQFVNRQIRLIDYYESNNEGISHYVKKLQEKPYVYGEHYAPFDIQVKEWGAEKTRWESAKDLGIRFRPVPKIPKQDGIDQVRAVLPRCWFDADKCEVGLNALRSYHREWDDKYKIYKDSPAKGWTNHSSDSFRYLVLSIRERESGNIKKIKKNTSYINSITGW